MNFKRFISGISAFAVAVSAFAAMTVTANAAEGDITSSFANGVNVTGTSITEGVNLDINHKWESEGYQDPVSVTVDPIDAANKIIHFEIQNKGNKNSGGIITLDGLGLSIQKTKGNDETPNNVRFYGEKASNNVTIDAGTIKTVDILISPSSSQAATVYVNGKNVGWFGIGYKDRVITGITVDQTDGTFAASLNNLKVMDKLPAELTTVESTTYSEADGYDKNVTAAKLSVKVDSSKIKVLYSGQEQTTNTVLDGEAVIGVTIINKIDAQPAFGIVAVE